MFEDARARGGFDIGLAGLDPDALLGVIEECERRVAGLQARQVAAMAALERFRRGTPLAEFTATEVGFALRLSPNAAQDRLAVAVELAGRLPQTLDLLGSGRVDYYRARCVVEAVTGLDDDTAAAVQARVLPVAGERTATQLKAALRRAVQAADPDGAERRHQHASRGRRVELIPAEDGMAAVSLVAPADGASTVYAALDGLARAARREPTEARTLDQLRADVLVEIARAILQAGGWDGLRLPSRRSSGRGRAAVQVTVGADTLLGVTDEPGWLAGYGPIPASMARQIARDGTWRRILTSPATGSALDYAAETHDPGPVLAGHVRTRDGSCVAPTCTAPATGPGTDLDHTVPWPAGSTTAGNLGALCRRHHRAKQVGFSLDQTSPGVFTWTTPTGRTYQRRPPALAPPRPNWRDLPRPAAVERALQWGSRGRTLSAASLPTETGARDGTGTDECRRVSESAGRLQALLG